VERDSAEQLRHGHPVSRVVDGLPSEIVQECCGSVSLSSTQQVNISMSKLVF